MEYGVAWDGRERERAWAAVTLAACMAALLVVSLAWVSGLGVGGLIRRLRGADAPDSVCERCGRAVGEPDAGHACEEER